VYRKWGETADEGSYNDAGRRLRREIECTQGIDVSETILYIMLLVVVFIIIVLLVLLLYN